MRTLIAALIVTSSLLAGPQARSQPPTRANRAEAMDRTAAATYEHLAEAIIAIEATEKDLVKSILLGYHASAHGHLRAATAEEADLRTHLEAAAADIANIANEGDKRILAIRQRLSKAGHTHNTDASTKDDYLFIDSKEKKEFLALAQRVGQITKAADVRAVHQELATLFDKAIASD